MRLAALLAVFASLAGCSTADWAEMRANPRDYFNLDGPVIATDARVADARVTLKRGQALVVRLDADPSTGHRWEMLPLPANTVIAPVRHDYNAKSGTDPAALGVPGEATFRLRGVAVGTQPVVLEYRRPSEAAAAKTLRFDVVVQ